jgi:hypothetical protein
VDVFPPIKHRTKIIHIRIRKIQLDSVWRFGCISWLFFQPLAKSFPAGKGCAVSIVIVIVIEDVAGDEGEG